MKKYAFLLVCFFYCSNALLSQEKALPFWDEVQAYKKIDSLHFPPKAAVLFVGSSSFRLWKDVQQFFPAHTIINRGLGGSSLPDIIRYTEDVIYPYRPKQVVVYCGENDLAASDTITAKTVAGRFEELFFKIRKGLPNVPIAFVSIKPSPSRAHLMPKVVAANAMIKGFLKKQKNTKFVDVYHPMLTAEGKPKGALFLADSLHMNAKGYAIWQKALAPVLKK